MGLTASSSGQSILRPAARVAAANIGLLATSAAVIVIATNLYGASRDTDAYFVARIVPESIVSFIAVTLQVVAVPVLIRIRTGRGERPAQELAGGLFWSAVPVLGIAGLAAWVLRQELIGLVAPGFTTVERTLTFDLLSLTLPAVVLNGAGYLAAAILNSRRAYLVSASAPILSNVVMVVTMLALPGMGVRGWAMGYGIGALASAALLVMMVRRTDPIHLPRWHTAAPLLRSLLATAAPIFVLQVTLQLTTIAVRAAGSTLGAGAITALTIALTLNNIPLGVFAYALGTILVPEFAHTVDLDRQRFHSLYERGSRFMLILLAPTATGVVLLAPLLVRVLLERGRFDAEASRTTAEALSIYAISLVFQPLLVSGHRALMGAERSRAIAAVEIRSSLLLIVLTAVGAMAFGHRGIAAAYVAATATGAVLYSRAAKRWLGVRLGRSFAEFSARVIASCAVAAGAGAVTLRLAANAPPLPALALSSTAMCLGYLAACVLLRVQEASELLRLGGGLVQNRAKRARGTMTR